ncbi:bactofilin family protein [Novispirillum sp. DQ9]|uniref:bactofilin family protein n=1 Tax=Novispirillum sp. DQ9 TaxID=3398612 RepID=UPI003C7BF5DB
MSDKPLRPGAPTTSGMPSPPARNPLSHLPHIGEPMRRQSSYPGAPGMAGDRPRPVVEGRKLIVGRDIVLTGSIAACDTLVVEGRVESDITDASVIEIAANGTFLGSAEVDHAEIAGLFEGQLTVHKKLSVSRTGRIIGRVRYATIEIEAGGQIQGGMEVLGQAPASAQPLTADKGEAGKAD